MSADLESAKPDLANSDGPDSQGPDPQSFDSLSLSAPLLKAVEEEAYLKPSPIQSQAIPVILKGKDLMAAAQTGTGKTAAFTLPILDQLTKGKPAQPNQARALILTPTRELAAQIDDSVKTYGRHLALRSTVVYGGVKINPQMMKLRKGVDILVATPGRLLDLHSQNAVKFNQLQILVVDEADRMLDMGFIHDIRRILKLLPERRQNLMFSATFSDEIRKLSKGLMNNPMEISVSPRVTTVETVEHWICPVDKNRKSDLLAHLIQDNNWSQVLVFARTKIGANRLTSHLKSKGINAAAIHGNKTQAVRTKALADFKAGLIQVLVATDIAARGLDIEQLPQVVNFDLPHVPEDYIHRIGRTGRAGLRGQAISLVSADEFKQLSEIERLIKQILPRKLIDDFEPNHNLPESKLDRRPFKPKKPKKPKLGNKNNQPTKKLASGKKTTENTATSGWIKPGKRAAASNKKTRNNGNS